MATTKEIYRLNSLNVEEINRLLQRLQDRLDKIEGWRGTPEFQADISLNSNKVTEVADATADTDSPNLGQTSEGVLTTRGDLIYRDATTVTRLALGAANRFLGSDGTDAAWTDPATAAQIKAGASNSALIAPAQFLDAIGFSAYFESAVQTITPAGALTLAHGLGRKPIVFQVILKNVTAELGYSIGDEIPVALMDIGGSTSRGVSIVPDTTNLNIRYGSSVGVWCVPNKTTGSGTTAIVDSRWNAIFRAWA